MAYLAVRIPVTINSNPGVLFPRGDYRDLDGQLRYMYTADRIIV